MQYGLSETFADELPFIREIMFDVADDTPRMIYADWLDERNDARGEFLRIDHRLADADPDDGDIGALRERRNELIGKLDAQWVTLLARVPIELCPQKVEFKFMCPKRWENLKPFGDDPSVRYCDQCGRSVTYCMTIEQARATAQRGQCVAIDAGLTRTRDDLAPARREDYREFLGLIAVPEG